MIRTVISLDPDDKAWLDRKAKQDGVSMTEVVRTAVRRLKEQSHTPSPRYERLLRRTRKLWRRGDGLEYVRRIREEW
jgi:hypothetical protein